MPEISVVFPPCRRCHRPVERNRDSYEIFEKMHWACFHYEFEHQTDSQSDDPDIPCQDAHCPARVFDYSS